MAARRVVTGRPLSTAAVFLLALAALLPWLGAEQVWSKDEGRTGLVVREMIDRGTWLVPHIGGRPYVEKPPLYHWLVGAMSGERVSAWSLRLPAALASAATVAATHALTARLAGPGAALVAAAIAGSSPLLFQWARTGRLDALLVLWTTLGLWSLARWLDARRARDASLLGLWVGLGVLTKGPAALLLLGVAVPAALVARPRPPVRHAAGALAAAAGVLALWLVPAALLSPDFARYAATAATIVGEEIQQRPAQHPLFPLVVIGLGILPWTLLLPGTCLRLARAGREARRALALPLGWIAVLLVVFGVLVPPREIYFLPLVPALSAVVAWAWQGATGRERWWLAAPLGAGVVAIGAAGLALLAVPLTVGVHGQVIRLPPPLGAGVAALALAATVAGWRLLRAGRPAAALVPLAGATLVVLHAVALAIMVPAVRLAYPVPALAERVGASAPREATIAYLDRHFAAAILFQAPQRARQFPDLEALRALAGPQPAYVLLPQAEFAALEPAGARRLAELRAARVVHVLGVLPPR